MSDFPASLKMWRKARRFSQLALAAEADMSVRHLAFLETGRSRPSASMVGRLCDTLQLPLHARNQMLTLAGFAARYPARHWDASDMAPVRAAMHHALVAHAPYPALAVDRLWTVIAMNAPARHLFGTLGLAEGGSMLDLMMSQTLPPLVENWSEVAHHAAQRLRTESAAQGGVPRLDSVADALAEGTQVVSARPLGPVMPTIFRMGTLRLSLFAIIAQFGTPEDVTLDDLKLELYYPADAATEATLRAMAVTAP